MPSRRITLLARLVFFHLAGAAAGFAADSTLAGRWALDEGSGNTIYDTSGNNLNGTRINSPSWTSGIVGTGAIRFSNTQQRVTFGDVSAVEGIGALTVSAWVRPISTNAEEDENIVEKAGSSSETTFRLYRQRSSERLAFAVRNSSTTVTALSPSSALQTVTWYHVVGVYNGTDIRLYINGVQSGTAVAQTGTTRNSTAVLNIGSDSSNFDGPGTVDEVRIYRRALSAAEVAQLYSTPALDLTAPTVAITAPSAGATVLGTISLSANAADNIAVAGVRFLVDGVQVGSEDTVAPYGVSWNSTAVANGARAITAIARDAAGNQTTSAAVAVTVNNPDITAPTVAITAPAAGATVLGTISLAASAADNIGVAGVRFLVDGVQVGSEDTVAPYGVSWDSTAVANGARAITAIARDAAGNQTTSAAVSVTVNNPDITAPTVAMTTPSAGATVVGTISLSASAADNIGVAGVRFLVDGVQVGSEDTAAPYSVSWDSTAVANGARAITAIARDAAGNQTASAAVSVTVNNPDITAPTVAITTPSAGATVVGTISLSASAADNIGVAGVRFLVDGVQVGSEDTAAPYSVSWDSTAVANGARAITAIARDAAGNQTTSAAVSVTVNNPDITAPTVAIAAPAADATVIGTIMLTATAGDNIGVAGVSFQVDGVPQGAEATTAPYAVSWDSTTIANGVHSIAAVARDAAGNQTTSAAVSVTVNNPDLTAPTVAITGPGNGATVFGLVTIIATAEDEIGVVGVTFFVDGVAHGSEDTTAPYGTTWDTSTLGNGPRSIMAIARDAAGNQATSPSITVSVGNPEGVELAAGLVGHWKLDEATGLVAQDSSANGYTGSLVNGPIWSAGRLGSAVLLDGVNDHVNIPDYNVGQGVGAFSVSLWFDASIGISSLNRTVFGYVLSAGRDTFSLRISRASGTGKLHFRVFNQQFTTATALANVVFNSTNWVHAVGIYDGTQLRLYVNNTLQNDRPALTGVTLNTDRALQASPTAEPFAGRVDDIRVYHRALSAEEVSALFLAYDDDPSPLDSEAPAVAISNPLAGATVDGTIPLAAIATDDVAVANVQFLVDGVPFGSADYWDPYSINLNTKTLSNGPHTVAAIASDASDHSATSAVVNITVYNPPDTTPPSTPTILRATPVGASQVNLAWTASVDESGISYAVYRGLAGAGAPSTLLATTAVPVYRDATLAIDTAYWYSVVAQDSAANTAAPTAIVEARTYATPNTLAESDPRFSFGVFSDNYSGQELGMRRITDEMAAWEPNLHLLLSAGDTPTYERIRGLIDERLSDNLPGAAPEFPWFPSTGNHDEELPGAMAWWRDNWATNWDLNPQQSRLALQLSGVRNFRRGPTSVQTASGFQPINPGTIYSFDYKSVHFLIINTYEQGIINDANAGIFDLNGPGVSDPATSQLDWIAADLAGTTQPLKIVVGHVALATPIYSWNQPPPGWSEHNSSFRMTELTQLLSDYDVTAYFFGHDHVPSRHLVDGARTMVYSRSFWTSENDLARPFGNPSDWTAAQGPGRIWEIDVGRVWGNDGSYTVCHVTGTAITFDTYRYVPGTPSATYLWDSFTVPIPAP